MSDSEIFAWDVPKIPIYAKILLRHAPLIFALRKKLFDLLKVGQSCWENHRGRFVIRPYEKKFKPVP